MIHSKTVLFSRDSKGVGIALEMYNITLKPFSIFPDDNAENKLLNWPETPSKHCCR